MTDHTESNRYCAACGAAFYCAGRDGKAGCWCAQLPNIMPLPDGAGDCLCPDCLQQHIARRTRGIEQ